MPPARKVSLDAIRFGAIVRQLRLRRGWTLMKLAQRCGMNRSYLSIVERGDNVPSLTTILEIAEVLNVDAGEIVRQVAALRVPAAMSKPEPDASGSE